MSISVVIITKNEEKNIRRCLESVEWADEVIIVDDFSMDKTLDLAKGFKNVKIFQREWESYSRQKNFGIEKATKEWILILDADEVVPSELGLEILRKVRDDREFVAFKIPRKLIFLGRFLRWGKTFPDYQVKLFKKQKCIFDDSILHEKLIVEGKLGVIKYPIIHYSYPDLETYFKKFNIYSSLYARKKYLEGKKFHFYHIFYFPLGFFYRYILRLGFLDGFEGFLWCLFSSFHDFIKHAKLKEYHGKK